ncbi:Cyanovirin-N [Mycena epipterygia]|nr:Cyanovirin-N [Mycena epipterygia]
MSYQMPHNFHENAADWQNSINAPDLDEVHPGDMFSPVWRTNLDFRPPRAPKTDTLSVLKMNRRLLSSVVLAPCALAAIPGTFAARSNGLVTDTNLIPSCENISINLATLELTGTCPTNSGAPMTSSINLNSCVGNTNGELTAGNNFSSSCENIGFSGITLSSACLDDAGNRVSSSFNLGTILRDENGVLTCS